MGLFIGASILTILELFDYLYEVRFMNKYKCCPVIKISAGFWFYLTNDIFTVYSV